MSTTPSKPLEGVRVLDFGQYVAGPLAATLLAEAGAEVTRIERPGGPAFDDPGNVYLLKSRAATHVIDLTTPDGKKHALSLVQEADVLVENFRPGVMARLGLDYEPCRAVNPGLIYCSLPGFSEEDRRAHLAGWEGVIMAAGGGFVDRLPSSARSVGETPPFSALALGSAFAAATTALSAAAALIARDRDGGLGQRIETPLSDALLEGSGIWATKVEKDSPMPSYGLAAGLYRARDGEMLALSIGAHRHLLALAQAAGREDWLADGSLDYGLLRSDAEAVKTVRRRLVELFATRDAAEWEALLAPAGVALARVRTTREWLRDPVATAAGGGVVEQAQPDGQLARTLESAVEFVPAEVAAPTPVVRRSTPHAAPLHGFRVIDLSRVVAAPTVTRMLSDLGADVIKVDSDPARARMAYDEPLLHVYLNRGKRGAVLDLKDAADRSIFDGLVGDADVLVTNVSTGRLDAVGLTADALREVNPTLVFTYLNMYGPTGERSELRGYAEVANAATGVSALTTGWSDATSGAPLTNNPPWPYTDSMAGILGAFGAVAALYDRTRRGGAWNVSTCLTRTGLFEQMPYAVDSDHVDPARGRDASRPGYNLYSSADGHVFVALHPDDVAEANERLGGDLSLGLADRIALTSSGVVAERLSFGRSSAQPLTRSSVTMASDGPWAERGLRLERDSDDYGVVVTQGPVSRLTRTPAAAGPAPRVFGTEDVTGWID